ncbi:MAG TPA: glycogen debranching N-terminal domain-containing protein [Chloroflexia bacterium]|jgi:glycogen debranching enzyme
MKDVRQKEVVKGVRAGALTPEEHRRKELILTQPEPTKMQESASATVLKQGSIFLLTSGSGDVPWELPHALGLFYQDCRFLDGYSLEVNGLPLTVLSCIDDQGLETYHDLANPELPPANGSAGIAKNTVGVRRERYLQRGRLFEHLTLHNYGLRAAKLEIVLRFRAEFEDLFVLKGFIDEPQGELLPVEVRGGNVMVMGYKGTDGLSRATAVAFAPPPHQLEPGTATYQCELGPGEQQTITIVITPFEWKDGHIDHLLYPSKPPKVSHEHARQWLERSQRIWLNGSTQVTSSNPLFDEVLRRALLDLRMLRTRLDGLHYFAAGIPWFSTLFGRDASVVAIQTMPYGPNMARETLQLLARYQATEVDEYRDAEPGKILHEFRSGELARRGAIPQSPAYYGSIDATLLFLVMMAEYVNWSGDLELARKLKPNIDAALGWIDHYADHDGDGYLDYVGMYETGLINQGWKDAGNSVPNADGSNVVPPVAVCEVQAYLYRAWRQIAVVLRELGEHSYADELQRRASDLHERFDRDYWSEELGCYVLALQKGGRRAEVVSSNSGQVLWGGIAKPERAARVVERLMQPDMFSGWGVRTLSSEARAYNPISYHLGSVWPHDNGLIIGGFCRYGYDAVASKILDALFAAACNFPEYRMPELFCGYQRQSERQPVRYPVACSPQAWAAGAIPHSLWTLLGLRANALNNTLRVVKPVLPLGLDWLEMKGVQVGASRVDLRFDRVGRDEMVRVDAQVREGDLSVVLVDEAEQPDVYT